MRFAVGRQREPQRFLGGGLADRAGDRDDLAAHAFARGTSQPTQSFEHIVDDEQRRVGKPLALAFRHHDQARAGFHRCVDETVTVAIVALDREECVTSRQCTAVDRNPRYPGGQSPGAIGLHDRRHRVNRPEHAHATLPCSAASTASWSEKGKTRSPMI